MKKKRIYTEVLYTWARKDNKRWVINRARKLKTSRTKVVNDLIEAERERLREG